MMGRSRALVELAEMLAERKANERRQREERGRLAAMAKTERPANDEPLVNRFAAQHGDYRDGFRPDPDGENLRNNLKQVKVLLNRGGTAVERWIASDEKKPIQQRLFGESEARAIHYCQNLWTRAEGNLAAIDLTADKVDAPLGWAQQEAIVELKLLAERVPRPFWNCYENVCRFDEEAGAAGSKLASNSRSAIDAAKTTVAFTASLIAMWRRL